MTASSAKGSKPADRCPQRRGGPRHRRRPRHSDAEDAPVTPSAKDAFAAALARKNAADTKRAAHLDAHGGVGGSTANHKATRTFRRKSG